MKKQSKNSKKLPIKKIDGINPQDKSKIRSAIRQVWHRSYPRKLCVSRSIDKGGFPVCEKCGKRVPKNFVDHIKPCGDLMSNGFIKRMWVSSDGLQALCDACHKIKTKEDKEKQNECSKS